MARPLADIFNRRPRVLKELDEAWAYPRPHPEGNAAIPEGLPPCGTVGQEKGQRYNRAARFLDQRGWWPLSAFARLLNASRLALRLRCQQGRIPHLRVGSRSWWIPPEAVERAFIEFGDPPAYREWVAQGKPQRQSPGIRRKQNKPRR